MAVLDGFTTNKVLLGLIAGLVAIMIAPPILRTLNLRRAA